MRPANELLCGRNASQYVPAGRSVGVMTGCVFQPVTGVTAEVAATSVPGFEPLWL